MLCTVFGYLFCCLWYFILQCSTQNFWGGMSNMVNLTYPVHCLHIWFYFHLSCHKLFQITCYNCTNASMSVRISSDRIPLPFWWGFCLFQGGSSFESCLVITFGFPLIILWSLQTSVKSSSCVWGMLTHHTWVTHIGELLGWFPL